MKLAKQLLSALLAMLLAFGLFLPVHAEEVEAVAQEIAAQEAPVITITKQPEAFTKTLTNKEITLSVEAKIPEGVEGTLRYQWYQIDEDGMDVELEGETSPVLRRHLAFDDTKRTFSGKVYYDVGSLCYYAIATCDYLEDGQSKSVNVASEKAEVYVYFSLYDYIFKMIPSSFQFFLGFFSAPEDDPFLQKASKVLSVFILVIAAPIMMILLPIILPYGYIKFWFK